MPGTPTGDPRLSARGIIGKALVASGAIMGILGLGIGAGWMARELESRALVSAALLVTAAIDVVLGLRFLGERGS